MPTLRDDAADDGAIGDEELAALALAADPEAPIPDGAPSFWELTGSPLELLPPWYTPGISGRAAAVRPWQRRVVVLLVGAFLAVNAAGLCSTYGWIVAA